jgi:NitT/TauT family transport system substrate-binding protein
MDRPARILAVGFAGLLLAAGCSSGSSGSPASGTQGSSSSAAPGATTSIKVGTAPTLSGTSFYLAAQNRTFVKDHLSAAPELMTSGAQSIPLLLNGQIQFSVSDAVAAIKAISQGVPLEIVAQGPIVSPDPRKDNAGLLVGRGITSVGELAGKTVAVNALGSFSELAAERSIDLAGGNSSKVKFVELPIPQMVAAVKAGTVAGAAISEPFLSEGKAAGLKDLMPILYRVFPDAPMVVYVTSTSYASSHPQVVREFGNAMTTANATLSTSPATLKSVGAHVAKMTAGQIANVILPTYVPTPVSLGALQNVMKVMMEYKVLAAPVSLRSHVYGK